MLQVSYFSISFWKCKKQLYSMYCNVSDHLPYLLERAAMLERAPTLWIKKFYERLPQKSAYLFTKRHSVELSSATVDMSR